MSRPFARMTLFAFSLAVTGCGTVANLQDRDKVYGGARIDGNAAWEGAKGVAGFEKNVQLSTTRNAVKIVYSSLDLPLSVAADTVTLPITVTKSVTHWMKDADKAPAPEAVGSAKAEKPMEGVAVKAE